MNISIDFDQTYTRDPDLWDAFILVAQRRNHTIYCVTARSAEYANNVEEVVATIGRLIGLDKCIFTGGKAKRPYCYANGIHIHVWIDDSPEAIPAGFESLFHDVD